MNNQQQALDWLTMNGLVHWRIVDNSSNVVGRSHEGDKNKSSEDSLMFFSQTANVLCDGTFRVFGRTAPKAAHAEMSFILNIQRNQFTPQVAGIGSVGNNEAIGYVGQIHAKDIEILKLEWKIEDLKKEVKLLQSEDSKPQKDPMDMMHKVIAGVQMLMNGGSPQLAGANTSANTPSVSGIEDEEAEDEEIELQLTRLHTVFGDNFLLALKKMADYAELNPAQIKMFLNIP